MMLSRFFKAREFACKCGCGFQSIDMRLLEMLDNIRGLVGEPLVISSGCRCADWNARSGGEPNSAHTRGKAVDIRIDNSEDRFRFLFYAFSAGIRRFGVSRNFIHIDIDETLPQDVVWLYGGEG